MSPLFGRPRIEHLDRYIARKQYHRALRAVMGELERDPSQFNLLLRKAEILALAGNTDDAVAAYRQVARRFARDGFYAKAIALYKKILRLDPEREDVHEEMARLIEEDRATRRPLEERLGGPAAERGEAGADRYRKELEASALFAAFSGETLAEVLRSTALRTHQEGDIIVTEGEPGASLFLVVEGEVKVFTRGARGEHVPLAELGPGDFFGEVSLLTGRPRTATITAKTPVTLIELSRDDVNRIARRHPEVLQILESFYRRRAEETVEAVIRRRREDDGA